MRLALIVARKKANLTQKEIASKIGISRDTYSNIETGRKVNVDTILAAKIAKILGYSLNDIFLEPDEYKILKSERHAKIG